MDIIKQNIKEYNIEYYENLFKKLYQAIFNNDIDLLINIINLIITNKYNKYIYLDYLLNPDIYKYVKIPGKIILPTSSFQLHKIIKIKTNTKGNIGIIFNPFFIYDYRFYNINYYNNDNNNMVFYSNNGESYKYSYIKDHSSEKNWENWYSFIYLSSLLINNSDDDNNIFGNNWMPIDIQQYQKIHTKYRLVSSEIIVRYIGPEIESSGSFYGAIINNNNNKYINSCMARIDSGLLSYNIEYINNTNCQLKNYNNLSMIYNSYYYKQTKCNEGIKLIYYPLDNSYEEFINRIHPKDIYYYHSEDENEEIKDFLQAKYNYRNGFNFMIIGNDLPYNENKDYIQIEIICNFETFLYSTYLNYIPYNQTNINLSDNEKKDILNIIKNNNIFKANENTFLNINDNIANNNK